VSRRKIKKKRKIKNMDDLRKLIRKAIQKTEKEERDLEKVREFLEETEKPEEVGSSDG